MHTELFCIKAGRLEREELVHQCFLFFATKQCRCFANFTQNISLCHMLKMVLLHSHSRVGGNNRAHFEPGTIYIVTVGSVPSQRSGVEPHRHTDARTHTHTHANALQWCGKRQTFVYLSGEAGCSPQCGCLWMASMLEI